MNTDNNNNNDLSTVPELQWLPYPEHDLPEDIEYVIHDSKGNSYVIPEFVLSKTVKEDYDVVAWLPLPPFNTAEK